MRIGVGLDTEQPWGDVMAAATSLAGSGADTLWVNQIFGWDALATLTAVAPVTPAVRLGTAVVPVQPRHPVALAQAALAAQAASGGRLVLGVGLSHKVVIEHVYGGTWDRPATFMEEYLEVLVPLLAGEQVSFAGEMVRSSTFGPLATPGVDAPPVLVAALGARMLSIAGRLAAGTVTWMTGPTTVADHVVPTISRAASAAGRAAPEVVVLLPVCVTDDVEGARQRAASVFAVYGNLPSYRAMLDLEGASGPADVALVGDEDDVTRAIGTVAEAGATEFGAFVFGTPQERSRTMALLGALARA
jgi:F420-dependent oxidoreductase-like protein